MIPAIPRKTALAQRSPRAPTKATNRPGTIGANIIIGNVPAKNAKSVAPPRQGVPVPAARARIGVRVMHGKPTVTTPSSNAWALPEVVRKRRRAGRTALPAFAVSAANKSRRPAIVAPAMTTIAAPITAEKTRPTGADAAVTPAPARPRVAPASGYEMARPRL